MGQVVGIWGRATVIWPGLVLAGLVAMAAQFLADHYGAPVMLMALLLGAPFQFLAEEPRTAEGIGFAAKSILRLGVILLGARVSLTMVQDIGLGFVLWMVMAVAATIGLSLVCARLAGRDRLFGYLTGGAVAICGASAAMAISAVLPDRESSDRDLAFTVISVTVLSTLAMIFYPVIVATLGLSDHQAGLFLGGTIHDVAQVVGAGFSVSDQAGEVSTVVKLMRVTLLAPVVLIGALILRRSAPVGIKRPPLLPGFVIGFLGLVALNSFGLIPAMVTEVSGAVSRACLVTAVAAVGIRTSLARLRAVGVAPVALMLGQTVFIAVFVLLGVVLL